MAKCKSGDCDRGAAAGRKGFCMRHYLAQYRKQRVTPCSYCGRTSVARGLCAAHWSRRRRGYDMNKPLVPRYKDRPCSVNGCERKAKGLGLCQRHYTRQRDGVPLDAPPRKRKGKFTNSYGYVQLVFPDRTTVLEHRHIMAGLLNRPLTDEETVHHKNGRRDDNRPENLELWSSRQPAGQRVADKVRWAREILALYGALFPE